MDRLPLESEPRLCIAQHPEADALLSRDPFSLLTGMLLDQQFPMERAFQGPLKLVERLGLDRLDPGVVAGYEPEAFADLAATPPAIHRYGRSMAARVQQMARVVVDDYAGDAARIWADAKTGAELKGRLMALPGWGEMKAKIFVALLGKQLGVRPRGWREAAGAYAEPKATRSVADVVDAASLAKVRAFKQEAKAAARATAG